jgi:hypothetical protein
MDLLLDHRETGRNPTILFGLSASAVLIFTTEMQSVPMLVWALWFPCTLALLYVYIANPVSGSRIMDGIWTCYTGDGRCHIPLENVEHVHVMAWRDGVQTCRVYLIDGRIISLPSSCLPHGNKLAPALESAGITVTRD